MLPELLVKEVPSGTDVFDWTVPPEWNVTEAWLEDPSGNRIVDFAKYNLQLVSYSEPVDAKLSLDELQLHLHSLEDQPDVIPYRSTYYNRTWGFCLPHRERVELPEGEYHAVIRSSLDESGSLTYGEWYKAGETDEEFLLSCYICHPSMANDSLSGVALLTELGRWLQTQSTRYSYRIVFVPETIGAIAWLANQSMENLVKIRHGLVATCCGDKGPFTYKRSRQGEAEIDRIVEHLLATKSNHETIVEDFFPIGSDERQYCSPGFNLPVGSLMRSRYHTFPQYHTSADNLDFVTAKALGESFAAYQQVIEIAESNETYITKVPYCEPQLGRRGLYPTTGGVNARTDTMQAMMWLLNLADGRHDLLAIAQRGGVDFSVLAAAAKSCRNNGLIELANGQFIERLS
ncbi:Protein containing aminopeptidase domain protein [Rhodopirellula europaea SH398]|uniref:Protein containing aminopeptidase domain protein n=1 Tax=Rhodopirellula europaea SH398 TaxID=1263868 RepID=M5RZX9_9BACT|nr:Protein containing aminopeptidase domain protein [Rhodopirellula europaea SH398]